MNDKDKLLFREVSDEMRHEALVGQLATTAWRSRLYAPFQEDVLVLLAVSKDLDKIKTLPDTLLRNNTIKKIEYFLENGEYIESLITRLNITITDMENENETLRQSIVKINKTNESASVLHKCVTERLLSKVVQAEEAVELLAVRAQELETQLNKPRIYRLFKS